MPEVHIYATPQQVARAAPHIAHGVKLSSLLFRALQVALLPWVGKEVGSATVGCVVSAHLQGNRLLGRHRFRELCDTTAERMQAGALHPAVAHEYVFDVCSASGVTSVICATVTPAPMVPLAAPRLVSLSAPEMVAGAPDTHNFIVACFGCCAGAPYAAMQHVGSKTKTVRVHWRLHEALRRNRLELSTKAHI